MIVNYDFKTFTVQATGRLRVNENKYKLFFHFVRNRKKGPFMFLITIMKWLPLYHILLLFWILSSVVDERELVLDASVHILKTLVQGILNRLKSCSTGLELAVWLLTNCVPTNPNQPNRRSKVQWYFPLWYSLVGCILLWRTMKMPNSFRLKYSSEFVNLLKDFFDNIFPWFCKPVAGGGEGGLNKDYTADVCTL